MNNEKAVSGANTFLAIGTAISVGLSLVKLTEEAVLNDAIEKVKKRYPGRRRFSIEEMGAAYVNGYDDMNDRGIEYDEFHKKFIIRSLRARGMKLAASLVEKKLFNVPMPKKEGRP